jgi:hypothetical protein
MAGSNRLLLEDCLDDTPQVKIGFVKVLTMVKNHLRFDYQNNEMERLFELFSSQKSQKTVEF